MYGHRLKMPGSVDHSWAISSIGDDFRFSPFNHQQRWLTRWNERSGDGARGDVALRPFGSTRLYDAILAGAGHDVRIASAPPF